MSIPNQVWLGTRSFYYKRVIIFIRKRLSIIYKSFEMISILNLNSYSNNIIKANMTKQNDIQILYAVLYFSNIFLKQSPKNAQAIAPETPISAMVTV